MCRSSSNRSSDPLTQAALSDFPNVRTSDHSLCNASAALYTEAYALTHILFRLMQQVTTDVTRAMELQRRLLYEYNMQVMGTKCWYKDGKTTF